MKQQLATAFSVPAGASRRLTLPPEQPTSALNRDCGRWSGQARTQKVSGRQERVKTLVIGGGGEHAQGQGDRAWPVTSAQNKSVSSQLTMGWDGANVKSESKRPILQAIPRQQKSALQHQLRGLKCR